MVPLNRTLTFQHITKEIPLSCNKTILVRNKYIISRINNDLSSLAELMFQDSASISQNFA